MLTVANMTSDIASTFPNQFVQNPFKLQLKYYNSWSRLQLISNRFPYIKRTIYFALDKAVIFHYVWLTY